jgi:circadian clock protein KaiB
MKDNISNKKAQEKQEKKDMAEEIEKKVMLNRKSKYILTLYISGATKRSKTAVDNIKKICEENLKGRYNLEIIDVFQQPEKLRSEQIIAVPTLIKRLPIPIRRFIGDLSDKDKVLVGLGLEKI